ncbi:S-adenosyl-L-methionine-dependent methyltransferase [Terfezia claveryi]|nr:S-adenosyl-L-methionine-dependent methyltransferase [Terfezia claveryi]
MDSPLVSSIFRTLFHHRALLLRRSSPLLARPHPPRPNANVGRRALVASSTPGGGHHQKKAKKKKEEVVAWQPRSIHMYQDVSQEFDRYPMVTAADLVGRRERPKRVKMWARDFIDDSLYNPNYGYFSKQAVIFTPGEPFDFSSITDDLDFTRVLGQRYTEFEDALDAKEGVNDVRQLWHTPTELFKPHYGYAIARYLVTNYKLSLYPYHDLVIYEMGAGNGTLMTNILDYIRDTDPDVYERTRYKIIEISPQLADLQRNAICSPPTSLNTPESHLPKVEIINKSIFSWDTYIPSPCFFLALEVFDNFAHDILRYDYRTSQPLQGLVLIDTRGDFHEFYTPHLDPLASRFLKLRQHAHPPSDTTSSALKSLLFDKDPLWPFHHPYSPLSGLARSLHTSLPFSTNLSKPEFISTKLLTFFDVLREYFPEHRLVTSDFSRLPDAVEGWNAPVVQTRYKRETVPVGTIYVHQGYFDILFPTDWALTESLYRALTGKLTRVMAHGEFVKRWCVLEEVTVRSGESPLVGWYQNANFMSSV